MGNKSWKTSSAGIAAILAGVAAGFSAYSKGDMAGMSTAIAGIIGGIGLMMARDNDKSSEQVGAGNIPPLVVTEVPPPTNPITK